MGRTLSSAPKAPGCACEYRLALSMNQLVGVCYAGYGCMSVSLQRVCQ
jgi:hypothetical protein